MRAVVCTGVKGIAQLSLRHDWPVPPVGDDDVLIEVRSAALGFPDVLLIEGKYQVQLPTPFVAGTECAGVVADLGRNVTDLRIGDRVISNAFTGLLADYAAVPRASIERTPDCLTDDEACGLQVNYFTTYHALKQRARLAPGETLLVLGAAGGLGTTAVQLGKRMGARVIAAAGSPAKLALAARIGADELIDYSREDLKLRAKALTGGRGVDVVFDPVGGALSEAALRATGYGGRHLVLGFAAGQIPRMPLNLTLLKSSALVGVYLQRFLENQPDAYRQNVHELWQMFQAGLRLVLGPVYALEDFAEAFRALIERRVVGKSVVRVREPAAQAAAGTDAGVCAA